MPDDSMLHGTASAPAAIAGTPMVDFRNVSLDYELAALPSERAIGRDQRATFDVRATQVEHPVVVVDEPLALECAARTASGEIVEDLVPVRDRLREQLHP